MFPQTPASLYELAVRESGGLEVALLWDGAADRVRLHVRDAGSGEWFVRTVESAHALDAFRHPFAYANDGPPAVAKREPGLGEATGHSETADRVGEG